MHAMYDVIIVIVILPSRCFGFQFTTAISQFTCPLLVPKQHCCGAFYRQQKTSCWSTKQNNAGITILNHPFGNGWNPSYLWWLGGWFIIVIPRWPPKLVEWINLQDSGYTFIGEIPISNVLCGNVSVPSQDFLAHHFKFARSPRSEVQW